MTELRIADFCAGIGGLSIPFVELGGEVVVAAENNKYACATYEANYGLNPYNDLFTLVPNELSDFDVMLAGFPCQSFSILGKGSGFDDIRGTVFFYLAEILRVKQPSMFLFENVKNLVYHDKGRTFKRMLRILDKLGYHVYWKVINANLVVPQNRERVYIVGFRDNIPFEWPDIPNSHRVFGDIMETDSAITEQFTISDIRWAGVQEQAIRSQLKYGRTGFGFKFITPNEAAPTLIASYKNKEILLHQEGRNPRGITYTEAKRLMSFPDDFKFPVAKSRIFYQLGNSVVIDIIRYISKAMITAWTSTISSEL